MHDSTQAERNPMSTETTLPDVRHVTALKVRGLFGHLNYNLPEQPYESTHDDLLILYGDNGSGKTTILRMLFYLLSVQTRRGYKSLLARIPFERFEVQFSGDASVVAHREKDSFLGDFTVTISESNAKSESFPLKASDDGAIRPSENVASEPMYNALARLGVSLYFLPDDRRVQVDFPDGGLEESQVPWRFVQTYREHTRHLVPTVMAGVGGMIARDVQEPEKSHHLEIGPVLRNLVSALRQQTIMGSNAGEEGATSIYLRVVQQLQSVTPPDADAKASSDIRFIQRLEKLSADIQRFASFGLVASFPASRFILPFQEANPHDKSAIRGVLEPYLEGLEARLSALQEIYDLVSTYVDTLNSFFSNKSISLDIQRGITVTSKWDESIDPDVLSSGERQLLLLLSNTILARKRSTIFIIDEPELSLNVKWQRQLVDALLKCSHGGGIQYILASHSLELITQYRDRTARLVPIQ